MVGSQRISMDVGNHRNGSSHDSDCCQRCEDTSSDFPGNEVREPYSHSENSILNADGAVIGASDFSPSDNDRNANGDHPMLTTRSEEVNRFRLVSSLHHERFRCNYEMGQPHNQERYDDCPRAVFLVEVSAKSNDMERRVNHGDNSDRAKPIPDPSNDESSTSVHNHTDDK